MSTFGMTAVTVRYGERLALDRVSLRVAPGEVVTVIGGDGAGKTTLCRVMTGLVGVSTGLVNRPTGSRIGHLPATSGVWPDLTVSENLEFVATAYRLGKVESRRRIAVLLEATGLADSRQQLGGWLSGGMRKKLGVAMALLPEPELLVLDEPTTGVDPVSRFDLWRLISRTAAAGTAIVLTTTYLDEAVRASVILALDSGSTLAWGDVEEVRAAVGGGFFSRSFAGEQPYRWRRGSTWRLWTPQADGVPLGARPIEPDLTDVLTAAALAREAGVGE
jgi:ABC-2 type transport system ATP-binding protein